MKKWKLTLALVLFLALSALVLLALGTRHEAWQPTLKIILIALCVFVPATGIYVGCHLRDK